MSGKQKKRKAIGRRPNSNVAIWRASCTKASASTSMVIKLRLVEAAARSRRNVSRKTQSRLVTMQGPPSGLRIMRRTVSMKVRLALVWVSSQVLLQELSPAAAFASVAPETEVLIRIRTNQTLMRLITSTLRSMTGSIGTRFYLRRKRVTVSSSI